jgi:subtilisin family serine protease
MRRLVSVVVALLLVAGAVGADVYESDDPIGAWILPGETFTRAFSSSSDIDRVRFVATEGRSYELVFTAIDDIDGEMFVSRQSGDLLAYSDDDLRFETFSPRVRFIAGASETISVLVREYDGATGNYTIALNERGTLSSVFSLNETSVWVDDVFTATINVTCSDNPCGNVTVTLDPYIDPVAKRNPEGALSIRTANGVESVPAITRSGISERAVARIGERAPRALDVLRERGLLQEDIEAIYGELTVHTMLDDSISFIGATDVWAESTGSGSVCVIDTGVDYTHPGLGGCARTSNISDGSCDVVIGGYDFVNDDADPWDDDGHGTHVAGIVASRDPIYTGVAPGSKIVAVKSLDSFGDGFISDILSGVDYCVENKERFNITSIVMSLGTAQVFHGSCDALSGSSNISTAAQELPIFVAAGNEFDAAGDYLGLAWPACAPGVIPIVSVSLADTPSSFSNRDLKTIFAPGASITSLLDGGGYQALSGTSMAAPHAAGAANLFSSLWNDHYDQSLAPTAIRYLLELGDSITDPFSDTSYARVNVSKSAQFKGVVPTTPGARPFWTSNDNPVICDLGANESCVIEWNVTAEGPTGSYVFFAFLEDEFAITTSPTDTLTLIFEFESLVYDPLPVENVLSIGSYNGTVTLREDASAGWISIDAPGSANDVALAPLSLVDNRTFTFERTIGEDADGLETYAFTFTFNASNVSVEHNASYRLDATYPIVSGPSLIATNGSFNLTFSESMDTSSSALSFPSEAQVSLNASWLGDRVLGIEYDADNTSFDDLVNLSWAFTDLAGNPADEFELRLDARASNVSVLANATNASSAQRVSFTITPSEPLSALSYASDRFGCTNETSLLSSNVVLDCAVLDGFDAENASFTFNLSDVAGNEASITRTSIRVDSLAPRVADASLVTRSNANVSVPVLFNESSTPITLSTGDILVENASIILFADTTEREISASDAFGNEASFTVSFSFDDSPPLTTLNTTSSWQQGPVALGFSVSDASESTTQVVFDNGSVLAGNATIAAQGTHRFRYRSIDVAGNREGWKYATVRIDDAAPNVSISFFRDGDGQSIRVSASDALSGIATVSIEQNTALDTTRSGSSWTASVASGSVNVTVTDLAGNVFADEFVVPALPEVFSDPVNGSYVNGSILLSFIGDELNYSLSNGTSASVANNLSFTPAEGFFSVTGNVSSNATIEPFFLSFTIDRTSPKMTIEAPSEADGIVQVNLSASDAALDRVEIVVNGSIVASGSSATYELDPLSDGTGAIDLVLRAYDRAGNVNVSNLSINLSLPSNVTSLVENGSVTFDRSGIGSFVRSIAGLSSSNATIGVSDAANLSDLDVLVANVSIRAATTSEATVELAIPASAPEDLVLWRVSNGSVVRLSFTDVSNESRLRLIRFTTSGFSDFVIGTEYATCGEGVVSSTCVCGSDVVSSGYCCSGAPQSSSCVAVSTNSDGGGGGSSGGGSYIARPTEPIVNETVNVTESIAGNASELNITQDENVSATEPGIVNSTNVTMPVELFDEPESPQAPLVVLVVRVVLVAALLVVVKRRARS